MARYIVGFDGKWQERFDDREDAIEWAEEVAATGRTVEVAVRHLGIPHFLTGFPEAERETLAARWKVHWLSGGLAGSGGHGGAGHHHYGPALGGHGGAGHGGGHGGH
jgi:hypothetical protein